MMDFATRSRLIHLTPPMPLSPTRQPPASRRSPLETLRNLAGLNPPCLILPRSVVHWMKLELPGVPRRFVASSLSLRLRQILGDTPCGFAWTLRGNTAELWYWHEDDNAAFAHLLREHSADMAPWPEPLMRPPLADGLHLIQCRQGFEALYLQQRDIRRTRWFAALPAPEIWAAFVRDSGQDPAQHPLPPPATLTLLNRPPRGWGLSTRLIRPIPPVLVAAAAGLALCGLLLIVGGSYSLKLANAIEYERNAYQSLASENAVAIDLQKQINQITTRLDGFAAIRPPVSQLRLMQSLVDAGLLGGESKVSLIEWEYRSQRLRLLFSVPAEGFDLGSFLAVLERQPMLKSVKLMPDTPAQTVGIQAQVVEIPPEQLNPQSADPTPAEASPVDQEAS